MDLAPVSQATAFEVRPDDLFFEIEGRGYRLKVSRQQPIAELFLGNRHAVTLELAPALDTTDAFDDQTSLGQPVLSQETPGKALISWQGYSARWPYKSVELEAWAGGFSYRYRVEGEGTLDRAYYWRNRHEGSAAHAVRLFNPEPNSRAVRYTGEKCWQGADCYVCYPDPAAGQAVPPDYMTISVGRDKNYHGGNWFFTPAPFCYALEGDRNWLTFGVAARPGEWNFSDYIYPGSDFGFGLVYNGHVKVKGYWQSPAMLCLVAPDEYTAIENYCETLRAKGLTAAHGRGLAQGWWQEPIFCGWGEQVSQEVHLGGPKAPDRATQANYQQWMDLLDARQLNPGMVVIDDKWQLHYGLNEPDPAKWPDMAAFIARQHQQGRKVLLWLKAWDPEGVPAAECITDREGHPVAVDPGHPAFKERLAGQVRHMLGELGADGFKVDFTHLIPRGLALAESPAIQERDNRPGKSGWQPGDALAPVTGSAGGKWGLELLREWLQILSETARAVHPEALIVTHTANPYLADLVDVLRLNDVAGLQDIYGSIVPDMRHRTRIARAASPYWLLDADNWPCASRRQWSEYIQAQQDGRFGIPALYHIERFGWGGVNEALDEEDFRAVREAWKFYRATLVQGPQTLVQKIDQLQT